jgi:acetyl esterase/lipase
MTRLRTLVALALLIPAMAQADATPRFERLRQALSGGLDDGVADDQPARAPAGTRLVPDIAYGPDPAQRFDVYVSTQPPARPSPAPVIFFVHGGAWAFGDKAHRQVIAPKVGHWVEQGYVVISIDYRLLPTPVAQQAEDVAAALALAQSQASSWGGDPARFILMGHSAGRTWSRWSPPARPRSLSRSRGAARCCWTAPPSTCR